MAKENVGRALAGGGVAFGDEDDVVDKEFGKLPKMAAKGNQQRVRLMVFKANPTGGYPSMQGVRVFKFTDKERQASYSAPIHNPELEAAMKRKFGLPKPTCGFVVLLYETNAKGQVIKGGNHELHALTIPGNQLNLLRSIHQEHGLHQRDLLLIMDDPNFNKRNFQAAGNSAFETEFSEEERAELMERAAALFENGLERQLHFTKKDDELWGFCGVAAPSGVAGAVAAQGGVQQKPAFGGAMGAVAAQGGVGGGSSNFDDTDDDIPF